jgi:D-tyrosyl-tRNA(Tyr) deacylase
MPRQSSSWQPIFYFPFSIFFPAFGTASRMSTAMRAVIQRVSQARVLVAGRVSGEIGAGLVVLLGVGQGDTSDAAKYLAEKTATLRIFADDAGKMNRSLVDIGGAALVVSQFTLCGDARGQRRPSFLKAAPPDEANRLYEEFCAALRAAGVRVETGVFQTMMAVELTNDGPVTILLDSEKLF